MSKYCRSFWLVIFYVLLIPSAYSQIPIYVKGGIQLNSYYDGIVVDRDVQYRGSKSQFGFHVGLYTPIKLSKEFFIVPELQFIAKGLSDYNFENYNYFLEVTPMFVYYPAKKFGLQFGPSSGIWLNRPTRDKSFKLLDVGANIGVLYAPNDRFLVSLRLCHGISPVMKSTYDESKNKDPLLADRTGYVYKSYNRNIQLSVAFRISN